LEKPYWKPWVKSTPRLAVAKVSGGCGILVAEKRAAHNNFSKLLICMVDIAGQGGAGGSGWEPLSRAGAPLPCLFVNFPWRHKEIRLAAFARLVHPVKHPFLAISGYSRMETHA
jgi:hypothetical protein